MIANGVGGGKYAKLVECTEIRKTSGTVLDYVKLPGFNFDALVNLLRDD